MDIIDGDLLIKGQLNVQDGLAFPAGSITNTMIAASAGLSASKLEHQHQPVYAQNGNVDSAADRKIIHVVRGDTGTIQSFHVASRVACTGNATITVDLLKNGTTILSAAVVLDNANTAYTLEAGTISSASVVQNDVLEVNVTVNAGTGTLGDGVFAVLNIREAAQ